MKHDLPASIPNMMRSGTSMDASSLPKGPSDQRESSHSILGHEWTRTALESEVTIVAGAKRGTRKSALNNAAARLGHMVAAGYIDAGEVEAALMDATQRSGLVQEDGPEAVRATIKSGLSISLQEPEHPQIRPEYQSAPRGPTIVQPAPARESQFYSAARLKEKPVQPRQWVVQGLVPQNTVTLFSGDGGTGKSLLALQLAVAIAAQTAWIGKTVNTGRVIFLSAEDDNDELHRRLDDILTAENRGYDDLSGLTLRSLAGEDALLAVDSQIALVQSALFQELDKRAAGEAPALIVIDTLADVYPANENDRAKARQFVGILRGLAIKRKCAVLLLGHPSLTGLNSGTGTSGSTAWNNSVRSRLYLSRITDNGFEPDSDARVLSTKKANYGRTGGEIRLKWEAGVFVAEGQPTGLDALVVNSTADRVFLKLLCLFAVQGRRVNASGGKTYAPNEFAGHPESEGINKRAFKAAMERLLSAGKVRVRQDGPPSRRVSYLEAVE